MEVCKYENAGTKIDSPCSTFLSDLVHGAIPVHNDAQNNDRLCPVDIFHRAQDDIDKFVLWDLFNTPWITYIISYEDDPINN